MTIFLLATIFLAGLALVCVGYWEHVNAESQKQLVRIKVENDERKDQRN